MERKKNQESKGNQDPGDFEGQAVILSRVVRIFLMEKLRSEEGLEEGESISHMDMGVCGIQIMLCSTLKTIVRTI